MDSNDNVVIGHRGSDHIDCGPGVDTVGYMESNYPIYALMNESTVFIFAIDERDRIYNVYIIIYFYYLSAKILMQLIFQILS